MAECDACGEDQKPIRYTATIDGWDRKYWPTICRECFSKWVQPDFCGQPAEVEWTDLTPVED